MDVDTSSSCDLSDLGLQLRKRSSKASTSSSPLPPTPPSPPFPTQSPILQHSSPFVESPVSPSHGSQNPKTPTLTNDTSLEDVTVQYPQTRPYETFTATQLQQSCTESETTLEDDIVPLEGAGDAFPAGMGYHEYRRLLEEGTGADYDVSITRLNDEDDEDDDSTQDEVPASPSILFSRLKVEDDEACSPSILFADGRVGDDSIESDDSMIYNLDENTEPPPSSSYLPSSSSDSPFQKSTSSKTKRRSISKYPPLQVITTSPNSNPARLSRKPTKTTPPSQPLPSKFLSQFPTSHTQIVHPSPPLLSHLLTLTPHIFGSGHLPLNTAPSFLSASLANEWLKKNAPSTRRQLTVDLKIVFVKKRTDYRYIKRLQKSRTTYVVVGEGVKVKDLDGFRVEDYKRWNMEEEMKRREVGGGGLFSPVLL
ncbi:hypothetical protein TrST_g7535 [Triparma strigata]|uniref:Uncharacterized protein n=1 Tax=Triparma strigata TaxID=1606541 RepID=A0A9W7A0H6_9STRA|nr:hypothetical protein TrST_g7535 [Triparma strigata]